MADLFDPSSSSPPPPPPPPHGGVFSPESDEISSLLHTLLQHSSQSSSSSAAPHNLIHGQEERRGGMFAGSERYGGSFRFAGGFYGERLENALSSEGIAEEVDCESEDQEDVPENRPPTRSSSKRSRAAEVHNMSEKRRRQKINEKMKALQKLIPNSNKTDKASMLDEAIEYLKQLQLQVQMLTLRNGSSLHPFYLPSVPQAVQLPQMGSVVDEGNHSSRGIGFPSNHEASGQTVFDLSSSGASDYKVLVPMTSENGKSGPLYVTDPATNTHYRPFNPTMQSKGLCKGTALPQLQLDMSQGQSSSSGVSL